MGDFWKPTAEMYTSLFEKPKMAEKLLVKPPFKYIYDILAETTKVTGFAKGLYTGDELTQQYYESKERKMAYLQKMIDLVQMMSKETVAAKPNKIVAGHEPQNTNILLQMVFKLATSGTQSDPFVKKVLGGGKAEEKPKEQPKEQPKQAPKKEPESSKRVEDKSDSKDKKKPEAKPEPKQQPKPEPKQEPAKQEKKPAMGLKEQQPAQKIQVAQSKRPVIRPPSAKNQPKAPEPKQQPPPILDEDEVQQVRAAPKKNIKADEYSKRVQEAMQQEAEVKQAQAAPQEEEPTKKFQMGNLRKGKRDSTRQEKGAMSSGGQLSAAELDVLKNMIQTICQSSAPLGKSIEFVNDDIESMNQQLLSWRKQYNDSKTKMQNELKLTEDALVPLYDKLAQIQQQIKDQKGKIQNMKTQIIKNQSTIKSLLYSVVTTRP